MTLRATNDPEKVIAHAPGATGQTVSSSTWRAPRRWPIAGWFVADPRQFAWLIFFLPLLLPSYYLYEAITVVLFVPAVVGYNLVVGYGGLFVIFSAPMVGVGAYTATLLAVHAVPLPLAILGGGMACGIGGLFLGLLTIRLSGIYLALSSVGVATAINLVMNQWVSVTGGEEGLAFPHSAFGSFYPLSSSTLYLIVVGATFLGVFASWRMVSGQWGRTLRAMRTTPIAARACGINVERTKTVVVVVACFYWGIAGGLEAMTNGYIGPGDFGLSTATLHLAMLVIGGVGSFAGPVIGAILVGSLQNVLTFSAGFQSLIFALSLYLVVRLMPGGLDDGMRRLWRRRYKLFRAHE
jgi:branched-chain amino acid transport system permease protein